MTKIAYGHIDGQGRVVLRPVKKLRMMVPTPRAVFMTVAKAEAAAKQHDTTIKWQEESQNESSG